MQIATRDMKFYIWKCEQVGHLLYFSNIMITRWTADIEQATLFNSKTTALNRMKMLETPLYVNFISEDEMML